MGTNREQYTMKTENFDAWEALGMLFTEHNERDSVHHIADAPVWLYEWKNPDTGVLYAVVGENDNTGSQVCGYYLARRDDRPAMNWLWRLISGWMPTLNGGHYKAGRLHIPRIPPGATITEGFGKDDELCEAAEEIERQLERDRRIEELRKHLIYHNHPHCSARPDPLLERAEAIREFEMLKGVPCGECFACKYISDGRYPHECWYPKPHPDTREAHQNHCCDPDCGGCA
jgi:hypothetical protein